MVSLLNGNLITVIPNTWAALPVSQDLVAKFKILKGYIELLFAILFIKL